MRSEHLLAQLRLAWQAYLEELDGLIAEAGLTGEAAATIYLTVGHTIAKAMRARAEQATRTRPPRQ